ncbi:MAG: hypothetical protein R3F59_28565 [Myxococcota bacterium]
MVLSVGPPPYGFRTIGCEAAVPLLAAVLDRARHLDLPFRPRQRSMQDRMRAELVQREPDILHGVGLEEGVVALDPQLVERMIAEDAELASHQAEDGCAAPGLFGQDIVRERQRADPAEETAAKVLEVVAVIRRLPGEAEHHREQVLRAVGEFEERQAKMLFRRLLPGDVDGGRDDPAPLPSPDSGSSRMRYHLLPLDE